MITKTTIKYGTDMELDRLARHFLNLNDPTEPERFEAEKAFEDNIIEVSIHSAIQSKEINTVYDPTDMIIDDISYAELYDHRVEVDQFFLTVGNKIITVGQDYVIKR